MKYEPLAVDTEEIRVLAILQPRQNGDETLQCTLQHVSIHFDAPAKPSQPPADHDENCEVWAPREEVSACLPEDPQSSSLDALWNPERTKKRSKSSPKAPSMPAGEIENLEWRFPWGDYMALSYVWGDGREREEIVVNGRSHFATKTLVSALKVLRRAPRIRQGLKIWADAICINQDDDEERSAQVSKMATIYTRARFVATWLGPASHDSHLAVLALRWLAQRAELAEPREGFYKETRQVDLRPLLVRWSLPISPMRAEIYAALCHFLSRPYWRRLWILQEMASARAIDPVICGDSWVTWRELFLASSLIDMDEERLGKGIIDGAHFPRMTPAFHLEIARDRSASPRSQQPVPGGLWKLVLAMQSLQTVQRKTDMCSWSEMAATLCLSRDANVTDERDRVYGVLGLKSLAFLGGLPVSYKIDQAETFTRICIYALRNGVFNYLRLTHSPIGEITDPSPLLRAVVPSKWNHIVSQPGPGVVSPTCTHNLPSWVVCWTCCNTPIARLDGQFNASRGWRSVAEIDEVKLYLTIQAVFVGNLRNVSAFHCCEKDQRYPHNGATKVPSRYGDRTSTQTALCQTLLTGHGQSGGGGITTANDLLEPAIWCTDSVAGLRTNSFGLDDFMRRNKALMLFDCTLQELLQVKAWNRKRLYKPNRSLIETMSFAMNTIAWRRLAVLDAGFLALVPPNAAWDDEIYVVAGVDTPLVLRRDLEGHRIVGDCYVHGIMNGETLGSGTDSTALRVI